LGDMLKRLLKFGNKSKPVEHLNSKRLLSAMMNSVPVPLFYQDTEGRYIECNNAFARFFGESREKIIGNTIHDFASKSFADAQSKIDKRLVLDRTTYISEECFTCNDGSRRDVIIHKAPMFGENDEVIGIVGTMIDITDRKLAEDQLKAEKERLDMVTANMGAGLAVISRDFRTIWANSVLKQMFGDTEGQLCYQAYNKRSEICPGCGVREVFETGKDKVVHEQLGIGQDGNPIWSELITCALRDESGEITAALELVVPINERKVVEESLRESEELLRTITSVARDAIIMIDDEDNITFWNNAAEEIFGYKYDEIIGKSCHKILAPERFRQAHADAFPRFRETGAGNAIGQTIELWAVRKDGTEFPMELSLSAVQLKGRWHAVGVVRDITRRKQQEESLVKAKEAAESASRSKSEFLANMSHEIRTPLNGIIGMTELVLDTDLNPEQRGYLQMVKSSADALMALINDILDFSKIEAGKLDIRRDPFDLRDVVGDAVHALALRAHEKDIELVSEITPDVPDALLGDPTRLRQLLINIIGNAIKFTSKGEVHIKVCLESWTKDGVVLHFAVRDTGMGIPKERQSAIFEPFEQADGSTTREYGGTGLGLAISSRLVEMLGGRIWVESRVGRGSTFHFTVQLAVQDDQVDRYRYRSGGLTGIKVLIADDSTANRRVLQTALRSWGMKPKVAAGGKEALDMLKKAAEKNEPFELVILDSQMPDVDGFAAAEHMRSDPQFSNVPIIMLTKCAQLDDSEQCRRLGLSSYLMKPVKLSALLESITAAVNGGRYDAVYKQTSDAKTNQCVARSALNILLAEDNVVNQKLVTAVLQKAGYNVRVVGDGAEAVEVVKRGGIDLVLMDVQMPKMDGLQAVASIRRHEKNTASHIPVIAMTAHAMAGDKEKCLNAGMDNYISKPINAKQLLEMIDQMLICNNQVGEVTQDEVAAGVMDVSAALSRLDGDIELLREIAVLFFESYPKLSMEAKRAIENKDLAALQKVAHSIKGSVGNLAVGEAYNVALRFEQVVKLGDFSEAEKILGELESEVAKLQVAFSKTELDSAA